jgi:hypothetical protein
MRLEKCLESLPSGQQERTFQRTTARVGQASAQQDFTPSALRVLRAGLSESVGELGSMSVTHPANNSLVNLQFDDLLPQEAMVNTSQQQVLHL